MLGGQALPPLHPCWPPEICWPAENVGRGGAAPPAPLLLAGRWPAESLERFAISVVIMDVGCKGGMSSGLVVVISYQKI